MIKKVWRWAESAVGRCTLCDDTTAGPAWVEFSQDGGPEKAIRLICFSCNLEDLEKWYAERRSPKHRNTSVAVSQPQPSPVPQANVSVPQPQQLQGTSQPETSGQNITKKVFRDPTTNLITHVEETVPKTQAEQTRRRLNNSWRGMTPEKMMKVPSYRHLQIRKRQGRR